MATKCWVSAADYAAHFRGKGNVMSDECWRREVELGRMSESGEALEQATMPRVRLWDRWLHCWVIYHGHLRHDDLGPYGRYSRTEVV